MHNITIINCEPNNQFSPLQTLDYPEEHSSHPLRGGIVKSSSSADIWKKNRCIEESVCAGPFVSMTDSGNGGQHD
jgi:hypothetical protein